jgi:hypothetical protein
MKTIFIIIAAIGMGAVIYLGSTQLAIGVAVGVVFGCLFAVVFSKKVEGKSRNHRLSC